MPSLAATEWTITDATRACDEEDTSCTWTFGIDAEVSYPNWVPQDGTPEDEAWPIPCTHIVNATEAAPASQAISGQTKCRWFNVTSTWSAGVGEDEGFTTLSVVDYPKDWIIYPSYKDTQVRDGDVVKPDQSYILNQIPS